MSTTDMLETPSSRRRLPLLWLLGIALIMAIAAGANWMLILRAGDRDSSSRVEPGSLPRGDEKGIVCFGHVDVEQGVVSLYPLQSGRVKEVLVAESQVIKAGAEVLRLEDRLPRLQVAEATADLKAAQSQQGQARQAPEQHQARLAQQQASIAAAEERLAAARNALVHKQRLFGIQQLSKEETDAAANLVKEAEAGARAGKEKLRELQLLDPAVLVQRAEADVQAKQARLDQARFALSECVLVAPCDGEVFRILCGPGDVLGPNPKQPAVLFCPAKPRLIRAEVTQEFADRVAVGQPAIIENDTRAGETWTGKVQRLSNWYTLRRTSLPEPIQLNDVRTIECILSIDPGQAPLRIGQRVRVTINRNPL